jgi:2-dehydro-3-deoxygluconokinase
MTMHAPGGLRPRAQVLTVGESMALFDPVDHGEVTAGAEFTLRVAGAESNFAIGLTRLGVPVRWISRLGGDMLGDVVRQALAGEALELSYVVEDAAAPTGLLIKQRVGLETRVHYRRTGSAACGLTREDVPDEALLGIKLVHLTGITMALADDARELVVDLARRASRRGITVMFDPNWRPALWGDPGRAAAAQREVLPFVDWYCCNRAEGEALFGTAAPAEIVRRATEQGAQDVVIRMGRSGALVRGELALPPTLVDIVDEVGAGDAFDAGFAYGLLHGWEPRRSAIAGNAMAACALEATGDWETLPDASELAMKMGQPPERAEDRALSRPWRP